MNERRTAMESSRAQLFAGGTVATARVQYAENLASRHHHPKSIMLIFRHHFVSRTLALRPRVRRPPLHVVRKAEGPLVVDAPLP
jgi:hypothetical protein